MGNHPTSRHPAEPSRGKTIFEPLFDLGYDKKYERQRKIVNVIRHQGFHLDSENKVTKKALEKLNLPRYDFITTSSRTRLDIFFELADVLDMNYLIDSFKNVEDDEREVFADIQEMTSEFAIQYARGLDKFISGLMEEMNFDEYSDLIDINF